ncbi:MAG TPA: (2Fe-2S) ferredoxin domain-containing protein [Coleofasciculaceae cyanobacterium]
MAGFQRTGDRLSVMNCPKTVLVCQGHACRKSKAAKVLAAFRSQLLPNAAAALPNLELPIEIVSSPCLGQCGNGPMVLVMPDLVWYHRVSPEEVQAIIERHLYGGQPVQAMLYRKFHAQPGL